MLYWWEKGYYGYSNENYYLKEDLINSFKLGKYFSPVTDEEHDTYFGPLNEEDLLIKRKIKEKENYKKKRDLEYRLEQERIKEQKAIIHKKFLKEEKKKNEKRRLFLLYLDKKKKEEVVIKDNIKKVKSDNYYMLKLSSDNYYWIEYGEDGLSRIFKNESARAYSLYRFLELNEFKKENGTVVDIFKSSYRKVS